MIVRARWVLPIAAPPVRDGWVETRAGRIAAIGGGRPPGPGRDLGDVALLPGLVNAHTHLELSWMAGRVPPAASMDTWIRAVLALRRTGPPGGDAEALEAMARAAVAMHAGGTALVGDISNTLASPSVLAAAGLGGVVFHELLGFDVADPAGLVREAWARARASVAATPGLTCAVVAHAPYSVSPELFTAIAARAEGAPLAVHLAESVEEMEFLRTGTGPMRRLLDELGVWNPSWTPPGADPIRFLSAVGYLQPGLLIVHGVHLTDACLERARDARAVVVTCPRSNVWVGAGPPRLARVYAAGVRVAIGTDSLASAPTLNLFDELAEMRRLAPEVSAATLLDSATRQGADALGFGREFGTLSAGKRAAILAARVPPEVRDVEEYLVSGIAADTLQWVA